jgi:prepilin-type N-terminal cleavage/methylation domain-containing protein
MSYKLTSRGDTIIEVLLSIAIIGVVLAGAYATANHSSQNERDAQEHQLAVTLAQSQLEQLSNQPASVLSSYSLSTNSCFDSSAAPIMVPGTYTTDCVNMSAYPEHFTIDLKEISQPDPSANKPLGTFEVTVNWAGPDGPDDSAQLFYQPEGSN